MHDILHRILDIPCNQPHSNIMSSSISCVEDGHHNLYLYYSIPVDRGYAWVICVASFVTVFILVGSGRSFSILYVEIMVHFDGNPTTGSVIFAMRTFFTFASAPVIVAIAETTTCRYVVIVGAFLLTTGYFLSWLATCVEHYIFTIGILTGIGSSCILSLRPILIARYFSRYRSLAQGISLSGSGLGSFSFPFIIDLVLEYFNLMHSFLFLASLVAQIAIFGALLHPSSFYTKSVRKQHAPSRNSVDDETKMSVVETESTQQLSDPQILKLSKNSISLSNDDLDQTQHSQEPKSLEASESIAVDGGWPIVNVHSTSSAFPIHVKKVPLVPSSLSQSNTTTPNKRSLKQLSKHLWYYHSSDTKQKHQIINFHLLKKKKLLFFICAYTLFMSWVHLGFTLSTRAAELGIPRNEIAIILSVFGISDTVGKLISGIIGDTTYIKRYRIQFSIITLSAASSFLFILSFAESLWQLTVGASISAVFVGAFSPIAPVIVSDLVGLSRMGDAWGLSLFITAFGVALASVFIGILRDITGTYRYSLVFHSALIAGAALFLVLYLCRMHSSEKKQLRRNLTTKSKTA